MLRKVLHASVSALLLAGGLLGAWAVVAGRPAPSEQELPGPRPIPVRTVLLAPRDVPRELSAIGTLRANREALLAPELGGRVVGVAVGLADGATLRAGELLVQLDPAPTELELAAERTALELARVRLETARETLASALRATTLAEEQLALLRADEERWRGLAESGRAERTRLDLSTRARLAGEVAQEDARLASRSASGAVDAGEQEVALAGQRIALLQDRLDRLAVRAPFDGAFTLLPGGSGRLPEVGEVMKPGVPLGGLLDLNELQLVCDVHVDDAASLHLGARAVAAPAGRPGLLLEGQVTSVGVRVEPRTRTVRVEARVAAPAEGVAALADGAFCRASITGRPIR
ncbi:MAG: HlyD family efflux transporter periplasmic adaptor subunit, partial [Planctomycetota bacterium]|nr:HlyD family efflux transporter periplasmic adaptor subunit [Planctomycetota bacterium]